MPVEVGLWRIDQALSAVPFEPMAAEARLEALLDGQVTIAAPHLMVIGRQVRTAFDKIIDLLAIDITGNLAILELKRDKTYRDIVAQVLDYGSWVKGLQDADIARIFEDYQSRWHPELPTRSIDEAFCSRFGVKEMAEELNAEHELIIVAASLDASTERIVTYLREHHPVNINAAFFRFFRGGDREYLTRAWLQEPTAVSAEPGAEVPRADWNEEYYVSFGGAAVGTRRASTGSSPAVAALGTARRFRCWSRARASGSTRRGKAMSASGKSWRGAYRPRNSWCRTAKAGQCPLRRCRSTLPSGRSSPRTPTRRSFSFG